MTEDPTEHVRRRFFEDEARKVVLDRAQRFAEALADDADPVRRELGAELIEIVGVPS